MPIITVNLLTGRSSEQKETLIKEITEACYKTLSVPHESVRIIINEMLTQHYSVGGISKKKSLEISKL